MTYDKQDQATACTYDSECQCTDCRADSKPWWMLTGTGLDLVEEWAVECES